MQKVESVLNDMGICNIKQYTFNDCRDINMLPFDFYLPLHNKIVEYDGQHHFKPIRFNGISEEQAIINHELTIKHDMIKNDYCNVNHIEILRIPYYEFNNIELLIKQFLGKENNIIAK